jgi:hypothetical protein
MVLRGKTASELRYPKCIPCYHTTNGQYHIAVTMNIERGSEAHTRARMRTRDVSGLSSSAWAEVRAEQRLD